MTYQQAVRQAQKRAKDDREVRFVIREVGDYWVVTRADLAWLRGLRTPHILYCTADGER